MEDFVTWVDSSKIKRNIMQYRDKLDDFDLLWTSWAMWILGEGNLPRKKHFGNLLWYTRRLCILSLLALWIIDILLRNLWLLSILNFFLDFLPRSNASPLRCVATTVSGTAVVPVYEVSKGNEGYTVALSIASYVKGLSLSFESRSRKSFTVCLWRNFDSVKVAVSIDLSLSTQNLICVKNAVIQFYRMERIPGKQLSIPIIRVHTAQSIQVSKKNI